MRDDNNIKGIQIIFINMLTSTYYCIWNTFLSILKLKTLNDFHFFPILFYKANQVLANLEMCHTWFQSLCNRNLISISKENSMKNTWGREL